jgi:hypothetical protein
MRTSSLELLAETDYSGTTTITGTRQKAVAYYLGRGNTNTVRFISDDFPGIVTVQASLDDDPTEDAHWFDIYTFPGDSAVDGSTAITIDYSTGILCRATWIRVVVSQFTGGTIGPITLSY